MEPKLTEEERLKLNLQQERLRRLDAEATNLKMMEKQIAGAKAQLQLEIHAMSAELKTKYNLQGNDQIDLSSGLIVRAPATAPESVAVQPSL